MTDRITLTLGADGSVADAIRAHAGFIAGETLAARVHIRPRSKSTHPRNPPGTAAA